MEQVLYKLPEGWEWKSLGDLVEFKNGYAFKSNVFSDSGIPILRISNIQNGGISDRNMAYIPLEKLDVKAADFYVEPGDIVIAMSGATTGKVATNNTEDRLLQNQRVGRFIITNKIFRKYVLYYLGNMVEENLQKSLGAAQPNLSTAQIKEIKIPIQPANEQKRIVEKLDALLTRIDTAIEHLQESVTLADVLVKSSLSSMLTKQEHWDKVSLSDVCQITSKLCDPREEQYLDMFHVGGANITSFSGELIDLKTARDEKLISGKFPFDNSMVLYSKIRPYLMKVARPSFSGICSADIYPLTPDNQKMSRNFLFYLLLSDLFTQYAIEGSSRAGMPKVNRNHLFNFEFYLPPIDEQKSICESLDALVEKTNEVSKELTGKLSYLAGLKASILDSAFKGEL
ncbi:restriction endonuclease subunit S [Vibrio vulnificus]|uniref:restriction endonuclease subunit S n=1 Tax=Vibrio vulnificus TaxID=672 RepID=UPI00130269D3|nr:restriction endonuclease subunit S [Vibrio vulnificus]EJI1280339.1 restriction endonuclease subunit S [Vibrio vulnificus]EKA7346373.1 restriction endonuclease subunit S [Vibrio vulnificus]ELS0752841.1 restriction endonuclease subunit S [Vibrio vulnificus]HAS8198403.1 restriction endonuclease subunit S [Vibrio vulnificus]HAS8423651.1 restriction endonuclease subunit S [Vibrio vulnificus]